VRDPVLPVIAHAVQPRDRMTKSIRSLTVIGAASAGPPLAQSLSIQLLGGTVMRFTFGFTLSALAFGALAGCAAAADPADPQANDDQAFEAVTASPAYFAIRADLRKCASPTCGGWFVSRLNRQTTTCVDGTVATSCYTPVLDWSATGLTPEQQAPMLDACSRGAATSSVYAVVRGQFARTNDTPRPELGRLLVLEAWVAEGDPVSDGAFVKTQDNGVRCFAAPCPSISEVTLNTPITANIAELDWSPSGLDADQIAECTQDLFTSAGLLVAGYRYSYTENGSAAKGRTVTAAYQRLMLAP
jgi:hypothetical protein